MNCVRKEKSKKEAKGWGKPESKVETIKRHVGSLNVLRKDGDYQDWWADKKFFREFPYFDYFFRLATSPQNNFKTMRNVELLSYREIDEK